MLKSTDCALSDIRCLAFSRVARILDLCPAKAKCSGIGFWPHDSTNSGVIRIEQSILWRSGNILTRDCSDCLKEAGYFRFLAFPTENPASAL